MRQLITAATEWIQADTALKRIAAETAELDDYGRGFDDGVHEAQNAWLAEVEVEDEQTSRD